jgi:hypothetical protein
MRRHHLLVFALAILLPLSVSGGTVYKWTDADGVIHYGDKKPDSTESTTIKVQGGQGTPASAPAEDSTPDKAKSGVEEITPEQKAANDKARQAACDTARENLAAIKTYARVRVKDPKTGEPRYLTAEEKAQRQVDAEKIIKETCK